MNPKRIAAIVAAMMLVALPAWADWMPGDPYKMHYPQLPDPVGWDVDVTTDFVYDDWMCTSTGPVTDVHFWGSWRSDVESPISWIILEVWSDLPADDPTNLLGYSHPDVPLWSSGFLYPGDFNIRPAGQGDQGWLAPSFTQPQWNRPDHLNYYQVNVPSIDQVMQEGHLLKPFVQQEGEIYWLGVHVAPEQSGAEFGWKTSLDHWNDDATYYYTIAGIDPPYWNELIDPVQGVSLDMAFVITTIPEPSTVLLLMLGVGVLALQRSRN